MKADYAGNRKRAVTPEPPPSIVVFMQAETLETIPARQGRAVRLRAGQSIAVVNTHGSQVLDTWAFAADDPTEYMSMEHTRSSNSRWTPTVGTVFVSTRRRPMLTLVEDSSPGVHDTLLCACSPEIYRELGCTDWHASCEENLHAALAAVGVLPPCTPGPLNLFMNVPVAPDGTLDRYPPASRPGDRVVLRAETELWLVFSACPQDITLINGEGRTPMDAHFALL
ncbi:MAG: urea carboxylase-associated family protein [Acetobacteraceae bacterium]|nr:urea carboxylase-associated family protein [Acetobacteraceae bacterium]